MTIFFAPNICPMTSYADGKNLHTTVNAMVTIVLPFNVPNPRQIKLQAVSDLPSNDNISQTATLSPKRTRAPLVSFTRVANIGKPKRVYSSPGRG
jgi:hypothetical protein